MSTDYIVTFQNDGYVKSIKSVCNNNRRLNIKHPLKDDTFTFTINTDTVYRSVRVFAIGSNGQRVDAKHLFNHPQPNPSAYMPFGVALTVAYDGVIKKRIFWYEPSKKVHGSPTDPDPDPGSGLSPPDTGTIKVGG